MDGSGTEMLAIKENCLLEVFPTLLHLSSIRIMCGKVLVETMITKIGALGVGRIVTINKIATSQICEVSVSIYFVPKNQISHPLTVTFSQVVPGRKSS
jgi:hypothetical protein